MLRLIAFIVFAQKIGYSLDEIAEQLVSLPEDTAPSNKDWQRLSRGWKQRVASRIEELQRLYINLDECIGCGCLSLKRCKLTNPEDRAGRNGLARGAGSATSRPRISHDRRAGCGARCRRIRPPG